MFLRKIKIFNQKKRLRSIKGAFTGYRLWGLSLLIHFHIIHNKDIGIDRISQVIFLGRKLHTQNEVFFNARDAQRDFVKFIAVDEKRVFFGRPFQGKRVETFAHAF